MSIPDQELMIGAFYFAGACLLTFLAGFPVYRVLAKKGVLDCPNARSSHDRPTVRGGGIAIMLVVVAGLIVLGATQPRLELWVLAAGIVLLAALSWIDDLQELASGVRLLAHAVIAFGFLLCLGLPLMGIAFSEGVDLFLPLLLSVIIGVLWLAGYTNAFNFMDGINGISGVQAGVTGVGMGIIAGTATGEWGHPAVIASFLASGAAIGFLPHNFPRARMFLGDVGSAPLGFLLAALTLWLAADLGWWLLPPLALLHANYVFDTGFTLGRRILRGDSWHSAHREHFYQRLVRSGRSHAFVTLAEGALQVLILALMLAYVFFLPAIRILLVVVVTAIWAAFYAYCERRFLTFRHLEESRADAGRLNA